MLALQRAEAGLAGDLGELPGRIGDAKERIARAEQQIAQLRSAAMQKAIEELRATETELDDVQEQIRAAHDVVERIEVRAPVRGIVVKLNQHTAGGVVAAGAVILELLPVNDELIIEARVKPNDICAREEGPARAGAAVRPQPAHHADDRRQGDLPFRRRRGRPARVQAEQEAASRPASMSCASGSTSRTCAARSTVFRPTPGMPADVFIKTGERTFFDYIMRPVLDSFSRAFRES